MLVQRKAFKMGHFQSNTALDGARPPEGPQGTRPRARWAALALQPRKSGVGAGLERQCPRASGCSSRAQLASHQQDEPAGSSWGSKRAGSPFHRRPRAPRCPQEPEMRREAGAASCLVFYFIKQAPPRPSEPRPWVPPSSTSQPSGFFPLPAAASLASTFP